LTRAQNHRSGRRPYRPGDVGATNSAPIEAEHRRQAAEAFSSLVEKAFGAIEAQLACLLIEHEFALNSKISAISIN